MQTVVGEDANTMPALPACGEEFINQYSGNFHSPGFPTYTHNQDCAWRIMVPEGMTLTISLYVNMEWA